MPLRLLTFGVPLELIGPDGGPYKLANAKHLALLAYLALEPGAYARDWLTRFIWSSGEAGSMNDAISSLRGVFGPEVFPPRTKEINFNPGLVECDARELLVMADSEGENVFAQILELYRGPFLADFNPRGASSRFVGWVERKRAEFERIFLDVSRRELQKAVAAGEWRSVQQIVEAVLKRVSAWPEAADWLSAGEELRQRETRREERVQPEPMAAAPAPAEADQPAAAPAAAPASATRRPGVSGRQLAVAAIVATALLLIALTARSRSPGVQGPETAEAASSTVSAPPCAPGTAAAELIEEVFHYGVRVRPGRPFVKGWTLQNTGDCTWQTSFRLHHVSSTEPRLSSTMMDAPLHREIPPGDTLKIVLPMQAPTLPGRYEEVWELRDRGNQPVAIGTKHALMAMIRVPLPHYPVCKPGEGTAALLLKKYPDGTVVHPGESIRWSWVLRNNGECAWGPRATLHYVSSHNGRMSQVDSVVTTRSVEPGETYTFLAPFRAPQRPAAYAEIWSLHAGAGDGIVVDGLSAISAQLRIQARDVPVTAPPLCAPKQARLRFVDENWPDSSRVAPGQEFTKRWTVVNSGTCAWMPNYVLRHVSNTAGRLALSEQPKPLNETVPPNAAYTFEIPMRAPARPAFYREDWEFADNTGNRIMIGTVPYLAALIMVAH